MPGGYGSGYGGYYGAGAPDVLGAIFDLYCFEHCASMLAIFGDGRVSTGGDGTHFTLDVTTCDLGMQSATQGGTDDTAFLIVTDSVPESFTLEWTVLFEDLPPGFTDLVNNHVFFGATDAAGPCAGLFVSQIGLMYVGAVHHDGSDNLVVDSTTQIIPGSSAYVTTGEYWTYRLAANSDNGAVYLFVTKTAELSSTGHVLRAILPVIDASSLAFPATDRTLVSIKGTVVAPSAFELDQLCMASVFVVPNLAPIANAGIDQATRTCSIIQLDASQSFDPEGAPLTYQWRLIDAPLGSEFAIEKHDGFTLPEAVPTGFTDRFYSVGLGVVDSIDAIDVGAAGDVLLVQGEPYTIVGKGTDGNGFFVQIGQEILPDNFLNASFKVLRQRGISGATTVDPTFFPDEPGFYRFDLIVSDGDLASESSVVIINVLESPLPRGCTPDLRFLFDYLSDFWRLVEGKDRIAVFWGALAQVAASELYTLWQFEYAKSHRDIQRTFVRRWLHYDLLLGEPLPELTKTRVIFGGITSSFIASAGQGGINGTGLVLTSPVFDEVTVIITALNPVTAQALANDLQNQLQQAADSRFTTHVVEDRVANEFAVRIDAPFPFTVSADSTIPVFVVGAEGRHPSGSAGAGVGSRTYRVDRSLEELGIVEDDYLVLDGVAFRIARLIDDPADTYPFQRVVLKEDLPTSPSASWDLTGWVSSELLDFYLGLVWQGDYVDFEVSEVSSEIASTIATQEIVETIVLGVNEARPDHLSVDFWPVGGSIADSALRVLLARVVRRRFVPVGELVVDVPTLQRLIVIEDDTETLRRNVDYFLETVRGQAAIRFVSGLSSDPGDIWEGERPPNRLWAEYTYVDNRELIEENFGLAVEFTLDDLAELPSNVDYLSAIRGLYYAFYNGPAVRNLRIGVQILLGLPFAEEAGTIEEIRTDFSPTEGRILVRDGEHTEIVRSYRFPKVLSLEVNPATSAVYQVGDAVEQFEPLVEGADILDWINNPTWFEGILNQGIFFEVEKFHKFAVTIDEAAFSLSALAFVRNFILKIKPTYTYPLFIVRRQIAETEVSVTDQIQFSGTLLLFDAPCENLLGSAFKFDEPRAAGGGWRNQFDTDNDPGTAAPTFPVSDASVTWAFDKGYLCPHDDIVAISCMTFAVPFTIMFDTVFAFDTPVTQQFQFQDATPSPIPAPPGGFAMTATGGVTVNFNGTITQIRFAALGDPGADPTDYEVVVDVNGAPQAVEAFTDGTNTEIVRTISVAVVATDTIGVRVRPASGVVARSPNWSSILATVTQEDSAVWAFGDTLDSGTYCLEREL